MDGIQLLVKQSVAQNKYVQEGINKECGRAGLRFKPRKYRAPQCTQGNACSTAQLQINRQMRWFTSSGTRRRITTTLDGRIRRVTEEELTCTLDQEIHHLDSVKVNHHSSTAKGEKRKEEKVCRRRKALSCSWTASEQSTPPSSGLSTAFTSFCAAPLRQTPVQPHAGSWAIHKLDS